MFDVTMASFDGAEECQLVGAFILDKLSQIVKKADVGLYRDDGLGVLENSTGHSADKLRKTIIDVFKSVGLRVTIGVNLKFVNFLDATFDLNTAKYQPYQKPDDTPLFLNRKSNHPQIILRNLPSTISKRVSSISADAETFKQAAPMYNNALSKSGFTEEIEYTTELNFSKSADRTKLKRKRQIEPAHANRA